MAIDEMISKHPLPWTMYKTGTICDAKRDGVFIRYMCDRDLLVALVDAVNRIGELQQERDDIVSGFHSLQDDFVSVCAERDELKAKLAELQTENDNLRIENEKSATDWMDVCDRLDSYTTHCDYLKDKVKELEGDVRAARAHETAMCKLYEGGVTYQQRRFEIASRIYGYLIQRYRWNEKSTKDMVIESIEAADALLAGLAKPKDVG